MYPWKGVDYLIQLSHDLPTNVRIILAGPSSTLDEAYLPLPENIILIDRPSDLMICELLSLSTILLCPYRQSYEYGTSSMYAHSLHSKTIALFPSFEPFSTLQRENTFIRLYTPNSYNSFLSEVISEISDPTPFNLESQSILIQFPLGKLSYNHTSVPPVFNLTYINSACIKIHADSLSYSVTPGWSQTLIMVHGDSGQHQLI